MSLDNILLIPGVGEWTPASLFKPGDVGIWQDMSNFSTLRQLSNGTVSVTSPGDPIGFVADMSKGGLNNLGPELVTNGSFSTTDNWTLAEGSGGSAVISGGLLTLSGPNTSFPSATQSGILTANRWYNVTVVITSNITAGSLGIRIGGVATQYTGFSTAGAYNLTILSDGSDLRLIRNSGYVDTPIIDNISVREIPGYIATQATSGKRPILSRTPEGGVRNLLNNSNGFAASPWLASSGGTGVAPVRTANAATAPDGTMTASRVDFDRGAGNTSVDQSVLVQTGFTTLASGLYTQSIWLKAATSSDVGKQVCLRNVAGTAYLAVTLTADWVRLTRTESGSLANFEIASRGVFSADNQVSALLWEGQLEAGATATANQRVANRYNITEAGKRDCWAYGYDGIDDAMSTPSSVDMSGSDEMTVCVGVRKLSDASQGIVIETANSITIAGTVGINAPAGAGLSSADYAYQSNGTALATAVAANGTFDAPVSNVISGVSKRTSDIARLRVNGVQINESTTDQGDGNYGNNRIYFGARGEASLFYQGLIYQVVIINRLLNDYELAKLEQFVARKMGITL